MQIQPQQTGPVRPETTRTVQPADLPGLADTDAIRSVPPVGPSTDRSDRVSISDAGRALAARDGGIDVAGLDAARVDRIRDRVLSGAYDTLEVVDAVARRLLDSRDI